MTFDTHTELAGYPWVKIWISCTEHDDMDVNVQIRKIGRNGAPLVSLNYPVPVAESEVDNTNVAKFLGCDGMLRASHYVSKSSLPGEFPLYTHEKSQKITTGSVVELDILFWPIGMVFEAGEGVMLRIAGHELRLPELGALRTSQPIDENIGKHWIHTGGNFASYLVVPVVTRWTD
jgi:predicted acyl esterase